MGVFTREPRALPAGLEQAVALPITAPRALTAAAVRVKMNDRGEIEAIKKRKSSTEWQNEAWAYYDEIGEIKYAFLLEAAIMSRMDLFVAMSTTQSDPVSPIDQMPSDVIDPAIVEMAHRHFERLESGHGGISGLLRNAALNLSVAGECYLVQELGSIDGTIPEKWTIRSIDEIEIDGSGKVSLRFSRALGTNGLRPLETSAFVGRIWRPHPRYFDEGDSSMRALLLLCEELLLLNRTVRATAKSRLNAGAMFIPDGLSVSAAPDIINEDGSYEEDADAFERELIAAMTTPIADEDSASAVVPLIIRGPGELGAQIKQFKFERSFDQALAERADRVLERILQGLDVPKDVVTGLASVKYSNAIVINESMYRSHIEPLTLLLCDALTVMYMRPALLAKGVDPAIVERISIWYDPSGILTSADRATSANEGWDRYLITGAAWRSAHGFSEVDKPTGDELVQRVAVQRGQASNELIESIYMQMAPELMGAVREANMEGAAVPMPDDMQHLLETGQGPAGGQYEQDLPPEYLVGLPISTVEEVAPTSPPPAEETPEEAPEEPVEENLGMEKTRPGGGAPPAEGTTPPAGDTTPFNENEFALRRIRR